MIPIRGALKIGDNVYWESHGQQGYTTKKGKVVQVVPAGVLPKQGFFIPTHKFMYGYGRGTDMGFPRKHESYLVEVPGGKTPKAKPRLYWPVTSKLKKVE